MALSDPIVPVSPTADQIISATNASILIDFENNPDIVRINGILAYDSGSGFLNGYSGSIITWVDGKRIILNPPSSFTRDSTVTVHCEDDDVNQLDYSFIASMDQMTFTDDASNPDIIDLDGTNVFVVYEKRDPTRAGLNNIVINMRKHDPNTSEVEVITGTIAGFGRNPVSGKLLMFFNVNGVIYATEADASDVPVTLTDVTDLIDFDPVSIGEGLREDRTKIQYYAIQKYLQDTMKTKIGQGARIENERTPYASHMADPELLAADPVTLRIPRPSTEPEASAIYGYYVARIYRPYYTISGGLHFITIPEGEAWVDWTDDGRPLGVGYVVFPVYIFNIEQVIGPPTAFIEIPITFAGDILKTTGAGEGNRYIASIIQFLFVRIEPLTDTLKTLPGVGRRFTANITGFDPKGI